MTEVWGERSKTSELEDRLCEIQQENDLLKKRVDKLEAIETALERIASSLERISIPKALATKRAPKAADTNAKALIQGYCDAYKGRYGAYPVITGQVAGMARNTLKTLPIERALLMVQAFLQMDDQWFKTRCHDFTTFYANMNRVAVSLANGTNDPHEKAFWEKVYGVKGDGDDKGQLRDANTASPSNVGRTKLPSGTGGLILESNE